MQRWKREMQRWKREMQRWKREMQRGKWELQRWKWEMHGWNWAMQCCELEMQRWKWEIQRWCREGVRSTLLGRPAGELQKCLVLMADEFHHFGTICHNLLKHSDSKGLRISLRIVDGEFDLQQSIVQTPESLG